jgi:hypothetical protein
MNLLHQIRIFLQIWSMSIRYKFCDWRLKYSKVETELRDVK